MEYVFSIRTYWSNHHNKTGYKIKSVNDKCDVSLKELVEQASFGHNIVLKKNDNACSETFDKFCFTVRRRFLQNKFDLKKLSY